MGRYEVTFELNHFPAGDGCDANTESLAGYGFDSCSAPTYFKSVDDESKTVFAEPFRIFMKIVASEIRHALPVTSVTECILDAVEAEDPQYRYAPIPRKMQNWYMPMLIPSKLYNYLTAKTLKLDP
jgi:hypothetical protein